MINGNTDLVIIIVITDDFIMKRRTSILMVAVSVDQGMEEVVVT